MTFSNLQLNDNVKARIVDAHDRNEYRRTNTDIPVQGPVRNVFLLQKKNRMIPFSEQEITDINELFGATPEQLDAEVF